MQTTTKQLRRETGSVVRAVARGETVIVTYRGKPVAEMTSVGPTDKTGDNALFGIWRDHKAVASVDGYVASVRKGRVA